MSTSDYIQLSALVAIALGVALVALAFLGWLPAMGIGAVLLGASGFYVGYELENAIKKARWRREQLDEL